MILAGLILAVASAAAAIGLRLTSGIESQELSFYDTCVRLRASSEASTHPIVQIEYTEEDLSDTTFWRHPIPDPQLGLLLGKLADAGATVVAVDIYRGESVPAEEEGASFGKILEGYPNVIFVRDFGTFHEGLFLAPSPIRNAPLVLGDDNTRVGVGNYPLDSGHAPVVRRGLLTLDDHDTTFLSLPFLASLRHLEQSDGLSLELVETGDERHPYHYKVGDALFVPFRSRDGAYARQDDRGFQVMLGFPAKTDFPSRSFRWVVNASPDELAEFVRGKIVLVGVTAETVKDEILTPVRRAHRGLDLHATFVDQLLETVVGERSVTIRVAPGWLENVLIFLWSVAGSAVALGPRLLVGRLLGLAITSALVIGAGMIALVSYWWIPVVAPLIGLGLSYASSTIYLQVRQAQAAATLRQLFEEMLDPEQSQNSRLQREALLKQSRGGSLEREVVVMMTDLKGFSLVAEQLDGPAFHSWRRRYLRAMVAPIVHHEGTIVDVQGDAFFVIFGALDSDHSTIERHRSALQCALDMGDAESALNLKFDEDGLPRAAMRVGLYSGPVTIDIIQGINHIKLDVSGDAVNTAARLESFRKEEFPKGQNVRILAGQATLDPVRSEFEHEDLGVCELHGMRKKVHIFRILSAKQPT